MNEEDLTKIKEKAIRPSLYLVEWIVINENFSKKLFSNLGLN